MSEALVGLTIVALGTSLPELATCIVAAKKGEVDLAIGNIIGSNIMNIVLILGLVGTITQIPVSSVILVDLLILFVTTVVFVLLALHRMKIGWVKGMILILIYAGYLTFAIVRNYCF
jgi:cation:H+ antiporter